MMCEIDWNLLSLVFTAVGTVITGIATGFLVWVAARGVHAWKAQFTGETRLNVLHEARQSSYKLYEVFRHLRSPDTVLQNKLQSDFKLTLESLEDGSFYRAEHERGVRFIDEYIDPFIHDAVHALSLMAEDKRGPVREAVREILGWKKEYHFAGTIETAARKLRKVTTDVGTEA